MGRYGTSTLPDTTVHPDGTLAPIKAYQALLSIETHPNPKLDVFFYGGTEYAQRTVYLDTLAGTTNFGKLIGYAPPSSIERRLQYRDTADVYWQRFCRWASL